MASKQHQDEQILSSQLWSSWLTDSTFSTDELFDKSTLVSPPLSLKQIDSSHSDSMSFTDKKKASRLRTKISLVSLLNKSKQATSSPTLSASSSIPDDLGGLSPSSDETASSKKGQLSRSPTTTSIESTASSLLRTTATSFRRVKSLHRLREKKMEPSAPRPFSSNFHFSDNTHMNDTIIKKLNNVVQELLDTEKAYYHDMQLIQEVYASKQDTPLQPWEAKIVFANVASILEFECTLIPLLSNASAEERPVHAIGRVFLQMMLKMDDVYCAYCKRHQDAMNTLQNAQQTRPEVAKFLQTCNSELAGRTTSWDLPSLLIKPVQRVLKYPLLFQEMIALTVPVEHAKLSTAAQGIQQIADHINEMKRRKDLVDMIVSGDNKAESRKIHGINKTIARRAYRLKQATGLIKKNAATQDALFDALYERFEHQQQKGRQLMHDILEWSEAIKKQCIQLQSFSTVLNDFYGSWGPINAFSKVSFECITQEMEDSVNNIVTTRVEGFLQLFEKPAQVIAKRAKKLLDHDRAGADRQKDDAYVAINTQLVEELPVFLNLSAEYFEIIVQEFSTIQSQAYQRLWHEWLRLETMISTKFDGAGDNIIKEYQQQMQAVQECMDSIYTIQHAEQDGQSYSNRSSLQSDDSTLLTWEEALQASTTATGINTKKRDSGVDESNSSAPITMSTIYDRDIINDSNITGGLGSLFGDSQFQCVTVQDFTSDQPDRLTIRRGDMLQIWIPSRPPNDTTDSPEWWYGKMMDSDSCGWFPGTCCRAVQK
ncbi:hypothetical protein BJV82DRAFT_217373 [Fennellomyces sp. T-0311]|nr:hypothetical protein BJV82DRAFT_217373 [Fennellomyces sp. T-0311]